MWLLLGDAAQGARKDMPWMSGLQDRQAHVIHGNEDKEGELARGLRTLEFGSDTFSLSAYGTSKLLETTSRELRGQAANAHFEVSSI